MFGTFPSGQHGHTYASKVGVVNPETGAVLQGLLGFVVWAGDLARRPLVDEAGLKWCTLGTVVLGFPQRLSQAPDHENLGRRGLQIWSLAVRTVS